MQRATGKKRKSVLMVLSLLLVSVMLPVSASANASPAGGVPPGVRLLRSDEQGVVLELNTPDYELEERLVGGVACQRVHVPGYVQSEEPGRPQLPLYIALLGVPPEVELGLEVTPIETVQVPGWFQPCPAVAAVTEEGGDGLVRYVAREVTPDPAVYHSDRFYPQALARVDDLGFLRSQRIARLEVSPFQAHPASGELRYHRQLRVALHFKGDISSASAVKEPDQFEASLKSLLVNYESARAWRGKPTLKTVPHVILSESASEASPTSADEPVLAVRPGIPRSADSARNDITGMVFRTDGMTFSSAATMAAWTPPQPGYKIMVKDDGIYVLSRAALATAGLPVDTLNPRTLQLFNAGQEVAILVTGEADGRLDEGDTVLFYGQGADTRSARYTDTNVYWLTYGGLQGLRMAERSSLPGGTEPTSFLASVHLEENYNYISSLPMEAGFDHWYGARIQAAGQGIPRSLDFPFVANSVATGTFTATLEAALAGNVEGTHHLRLYVNGQQVHDSSWSGRTYYQVHVNFPQSYLNEGDNVIRVELVNDTPGQSFDMVYTDWLRVSYQRTYAAEGDQLAFGGDAAGSWQYRVSGFSSGDVAVFDVTDPARVSRIVETAVTSQGGGHTLRFGDSQNSPRRYLALTAAQYRTPLGIELDNPSSLQSPGEGADYIVITHSDFRDAVQLLAAHRATQGLRVRVVDVQDVYDEFGYGLVSAEAIRDFLAYAYGSWPGPAPSFVLLVGDGTYDPRHYLSDSGPTYIPPYLEMVDPYLGETATDNRYAAVSGDDFLPDLYIGRLPVNTPAEAEVMVNKILSYETGPTGEEWTRRALFITDDLEGGGGDFYAFSDGIADGYADPPTNSIKFLPRSYTATKVYLNRTCPDGNPATVCQQQIVDTLNITGTLLMSYIGHATKTYWAEERLMDLTVLTRLSNDDRLPIVLPMTCYEGYFHDAEPNAASLGETSVRMAGGGAVASWSPTGFGLAPGHDYLERGLFLALFHDRVQEIGAATTQAKLYLLAHAPAGKYDDLIDTFLILGDPALRVPLAEPEEKPVFIPLLMRAHRG